MFAAVLIAVPLLFSLWANGSIDRHEIYEPADIAPGHFAIVDGFQLHYQIWGDVQSDPTGAPIVLLHGFASSSLEFLRLAPLLAERRSVVAIDLLGFGFSERVPEPGDYYRTDGQAELVASVLDALGINRADVIGASYGGAVAGQLALNHPPRVRRLVLIDAQIYGQGNAGGEFVASLPFGLNRAVAWLTLGGGPLSSRLLSAACHNPGACLGDDDLLDALRQPTQIVGNVASLIAFSRSPRDQRLPAEIGGITQPTLIIWGEHDTFIPPADAERLAEDLPDARIQWIPEAGHVPHIERPIPVATAILGFLGE